MRPAPSPRSHLVLALAAAALAGLAGCAEDFPPASVVEDQRILALLADPPELDGRVAGATTTVTAVEAAPPAPFVPDATLVRRWSFCPFTLGASTAYRCAVPACETALTPAGDGSVTIEPRDLAEQCLADFGATFPPEVLGGGALPATVEVVVRYRLVRPGATPAGDVVVREAVQRIPVWTTAPTSPLNRAPTFDPSLLRIGTATTPATCTDPASPGTPACPAIATLRPGLDLPIEVGVTSGSFDQFTASDRTLTETLTVSLFTSAGRFKDDRGNVTPGARSTGTVLQHDKVPAGTTSALLWTVVRDLRGGEAVAGPWLVAVAP